MKHSTFTAAKIERAIKAVKSAGLDATTLSIQPDGTIVFTFGNAPQNHELAFEQWTASNAPSAKRNK